MCSDQVGQPEALSIAAAFSRVPAEKLSYAGELTEPDQWTLEDRRVLPMQKIIVHDDARTHLYVSEESGEVDLLTTRGTRASGMVCCDSSLDVFCSSSSERRGVAASRLMDIRHRRNPGVSRNGSRVYSILHAICRMDALALHQRRRIWSLFVDVGL